MFSGGSRILGKGSATFGGVPILNFAKISKNSLYKAPKSVTDFFLVIQKLKKFLIQTIKYVRENKP